MTDETAAAPAAPELTRPAWPRRWLIVRCVLGFCAALIFYCAVFGPDDRLRETALICAFGLSGAVVLGYLGYAAAEDRHWINAILSARRPPS